MVPSQPINSALFAEYRSYRVVLIGTRIEPEGDTAIVTCVRQIDVVAKRAKQSLRQAPATTFKLRRLNRAWVIESVSSK